MKNAFDIVTDFENAIADYCDAPYAVAVDSCTNALLLACLFHDIDVVEIPRHTYVSVPMSVIRAGGKIRWVDLEWNGAYCLKPYEIVDSARAMFRGMYISSSHMCLSFHTKKHLKLSRGGMILCSTPDAAEWYRKMRFDGRTPGVPVAMDTIDMIGHHCLMSPEVAAAGLNQLMFLPDDNEDLVDTDPDLSQQPAFKEYTVD